MKMEDIKKVLLALETDTKSSNQELINYFEEVLNLDKQSAAYYVRQRELIYERHQAYLKRKNFL